MQLPLSPPEPVLTNLSYPQLHESGLVRALAAQRVALGTSCVRQILQKGDESVGLDEIYGFMGRLR